MTAFDPVKKCNVCSSNFVCRPGMAAVRCPACVRTRAGMRRAWVRRGDCATPHPETEARLAEYGRRADAGLPLFGE